MILNKLLKLVNFFKGKKEEEIKQYSTTTTSATEGTTSLKKLNPEIDTLVKKITNRKTKLTKEEMDVLNSFYFNRTINPDSLYTINPSLIESACFRVVDFMPVVDINGDVSKMYINLLEQVYNTEFTILIPIENFDEWFVKLKNINFKKEE